MPLGTTIDKRTEAILNKIQYTMETVKGSINVQTENIFPIIKKFLYSDHEIFLRELVSNAVDASQKLKTLSNLGEMKGNLDKLKVEVLLDEKAKTITVRDYGIGMTAEEIDKYINQIAFSGAEEFVNKYKDKSEGIIGHFGLGFYSAFMVASKVEIITRSQKPNSEAVVWTCDGSPNFTMESATKKTKGTDVVLHIAEDSEEFLSEGRLSEILNKYCKFLPVPVIFGTRTEQEEDGKDDEGKTKYKSVEVPNQINNTQPAWTRKPADLSDENYQKFYRELYPLSFDQPLFHIHLNVDFPFNLTGILYFPRLKNNVEVQKNKINLYSNQVFITDNVENIVPEFLTLLHGVIDSPDIPLNVSRSYLQSDANVKKISNHITKKVADKLAEMFRKDREDFAAKFEDIKVFIEYGMLSDDKFYERAEKFVLFKNTDGKYRTLEELQNDLKATQTDKDNKLVVLYAANVDDQYAAIEAARDRGYEVMLLESPLTPHFVSKLEQKHSNMSFTRVDSDSIDQLIRKDDEAPSKLTDEEKDALKPVFEQVVNAEKFMVVFQNLSEKDAPVQVTQSEFMRRMKEQQMLGGAGLMGAFPEMYNLVVNANHPIVTDIMKESDEARKEELSRQVVDLAMLAGGLLKGEALKKFIDRSTQMIQTQ